MESDGNMSAVPANWATESMSGPRMRKLWFHEKRVNLLWLMTLSPIGRAKSARQSHLFGEKNRAGGIRTRDLLNPIQGYEMLQRTRMERHVAAQFGMECPRSNIHRALRAIELRHGAARCGTEFFRRGTQRDTQPPSTVCWGQIASKRWRSPEIQAAALRKAQPPCRVSHSMAGSGEQGASEDRLLASFNFLVSPAETQFPAVKGFDFQ